MSATTAGVPLRMPSIVHNCARRSSPPPSAPRSNGTTLHLRHRGGADFSASVFPQQDPLTGTLAAFSTYFIGFIGRPIGAAIFGHYGDRIGRKATLISTLLVMGIRHVPDRFVRVMTRSAFGAPSF